MRSFWRLLLASLALLPAPIAAQAAPTESVDLFGQFRQHCIDLDAKPAAVAAAATAWARIDNPPTAQMAALGGPFDRAKTWSRRGADGREYLLISGVQTVRGRGERRTCVLSGPADAQAGAAAKAWIGASVKPVLGHDDLASYALIDAQKRPRSATDEERRDWTNANRLSGLAVATAADVTTLRFSSFTAAQDQVVRSERQPPIEIDRTIWQRPGQ